MPLVLDAARYAAAHARVRGLRSRLLSPAQWAEALNAPDLAGLLSVLQGTWYAEALGPLTGAPPDATLLERALWAHQVRAARAPLYLLQGAARELLDWFWRRFEVHNLKTILRGVKYHTPPEQVRTALIPLDAASTLPWQALAEAGSIQAVVERLRSTRYGEVLEHALERYQREALLFVLEVALDLAYHWRLLRLVNRLQGRDRDEAQRFLGTWVDAQNLLWAYRYRIYARFSPEEILNYTLQRGLRVDASVVQRIALGAPLQDVVQALWGAQLPGLEALQDLPEREALLRLELLLQRYLYALAQRTLGAFPLHLGAVLAYEVLLESEVRDLVTVVEGKALRWPAARIRPYLIGERG